MADDAAAANFKSRLMPIIVVAILMLGEGVLIFFLAKAISPSPTAALGAEGGTAAAQSTLPADRYAEVEIAECRPSNRMSGKFVTFHIRVTGLVDKEDEDRAAELVRAKRARLEDGVNAVIRSAEPKHFNEPSLETIKRRLKREFDRIFNDDQLVDEVLIPQFLQSGPGV